MMYRFMLRGWMVLCVLLAGVAVVAAEAKEMVVPNVQQSPIIDGEITDEVWGKAAEAGGFVIASTDNLANQQTKVRALFTDKALYFAFDCDDTGIASIARKHGENAWEDDCVEVFLSPQRKPDKVYHLLLSVAGVKTWRRAGKNGYGPGNSWQAATRKRPGGWTAEIEIPFESFLESELYPRRGDLWGVKLTRENYAMPRTQPVELSSWTTIAAGFDDASAFGDLVFISRNLFENGGAEIDQDKDGRPDDWKFKYNNKNQPAKVQLDGQIKIEGGYSLRVDYSNPYLKIIPGDDPPAFRLGTTYKVSARMRLHASSKNGWAWFMIASSHMKIEPTEEFKLFEIYYKHNSPEGSPMIWPEGGEGTLWIDDVRLEVVREYEDPDIACLTGNTTDSLKERNIDTGGAYTYYEGYTFAQYFPYCPQDQTEPERSSGWVPFNVGRLTDGNVRNKVSWPHFWTNRNGVDIEFDLKRNYLIRKIEVYSQTSSITNCITYLKPADSPVYIRTSALYHPNAPEPQRQGYIVVSDMNSAARWVRLNLATSEIDEVRIWGKKIDGAAPAPVPGTLPDEQKTEPVEIPIGHALPCPVFPIPQEFHSKDGNFAVNSQTKIVIASAEDARARATAEVLRDEIRNDTGLEVSISVISELPEVAARNVIVLGEPAEASLLSDEIKKANLVMPEATPGGQGYILNISPERVLIAGCSPIGTFYGSMSLLQLLKENGEGWSVSCAAIRDWPDQEYRFVRFLALPQPRDSAERFIRALAHFKINYAKFGGRGEEPEIEIIPLADKYFVKIVPEGYYAAGIFRWHIVQEGLIERNPGESMEDVMKLGASQNPCPSDPRTWEWYEKIIAERVPKYNSDLVDIGWDLCAQSNYGSRWNVCSLCRQRNITGHELMAFTINKIQSILDKYGGRAMFFDGPVSLQGLSHPDDKENDWRKAQDLISRKVLFYDYLKTAGAQLAQKGFTVLNWSENPTPTERKIQGQQGFYLDTIMASPFKPHDLLGMSQLIWLPQNLKLGSEQYDRQIEQQLFGYKALTQGVESVLRRQSNQEKFFVVDIKSAANCSLTDEKPYDGKGWIDEGTTRDLRSLKHGHRVLAGVPFYIISPEENENKQCVMVHNRGYFNRNLPERVEIPLGRKAASLIFLHTLNRTAGHCYKYRRELAGFYVMVYEDNTYSKFEIRYNKNIANWDKFPEPDGYAPKSNIISNGFLAWKGTTLGGEQASLYASEWVNPYPERPIERIIFMTTARQQPFNPVLLSVTGIEPTNRDFALWQDKGGVLDNLADIMPQRPAGNPIDLSGGVNKSESLYIAPDGTRIEFDNVSNETGAFPGTEYYRNYAGNIVTDNNWGVTITGDVQTISISLPEPRILSCIGVFGKPTPEDTFQKPKPSLDTIGYQIDISLDGENFHTIGSVTKYIPEERGWQYNNLKPQPVKEIRIKASKENGGGPNGIACVRLYEPN